MTPAPTKARTSVSSAKCSICNDIGWVSYELPLDHPNFGRAFPCDCLMAAYLAARPARLWQATGIPGRFLSFTLSSSPHLALAARLDASSPDSSWFLWGERGVGKTGLAVGYIQRFIWKLNGGGVAYFALPDLLAALRATYNRQPNPESHEPSEQELIEYWTHVPLLVLDDMGTEQVSGSGWTEDRLYQIIGRRHADLKPIFVTSNLSPAHLGARLGERILWRIVEMCGKDNIVHVQGANLRA